MKARATSLCADALCVLHPAEEQYYQLKNEKYEHLSHSIFFYTQHRPSNINFKHAGGINSISDCFQYSLIILAVTGHIQRGKTSPQELEEKRERERERERGMRDPKETTSYVSRNI
jgi:hypothetical protein